MSLSRRGLLGGMLAVLAAPAIVRVENLMVLPQAKLIVPQEVWIEQAPLVYGGGQNLLTINMITRDAIRMFKNSNKFIQDINEQYKRDFAVVAKNERNNYQWHNELKIRLPQNYNTIRRSAA